MVKHLEGSSQIFAMNLHIIASGIGVVIGPIIGGHLYREFGYEAPFIFLAFFFSYVLIQSLLALEKSEYHG